MKDSHSSGRQLPVALTEQACELGLVILDFGCERAGVYEVGEDVYVTGPHDAPDTPYGNSRRIDFGTDEHLALWRRAFSLMVEDLKNLSLLGRTVVLGVPWVEYQWDGSPIPETSGASEKDRNRALALYWTEAKMAGISVLEVPSRGLRAARDCKVDPHTCYTEGVYRTIAAQVEDRNGPRAALREMLPPPCEEKEGLDPLVDPWLDAITHWTEKPPSIYRIWTSSRRYLQAGMVDRAQRCEHLIRLLHSSHIPVGLELGRDVEFAHGGMGIVIHEASRIGDGVTICPNVTIDATQKFVRPPGGSAQKVSAPNIQAYVHIGPGARILGGVTVGAFSIIGPNAVVTKDVPAGSIVTGQLAQPARKLTAETVIRYRSMYPSLQSLSINQFIKYFESYMADATAAPQENDVAKPYFGPHVLVEEGAQVDQGVLISAGTAAHAVVLRTGARLYPGVQVLGPVEFGRRSFANRGTFIQGEVRIGTSVAIGPYTRIITDSHEIGPGTRRAGAGRKDPVIIENGVWIGASTTILGGVTIGRGAIVAAGALVNRDVPANTVVAGVPAKVVRYLETSDDR